MKRTSSTADTLPDELVLEILARVTDVAALFRCATTCERWRRLVADPFFLRHCWLKRAHHPASSVLGFFATTRTHRTDEENRIITVHRLAFVPLPRLAIGFGRSFTGSTPSCTAGLLDSTSTIALASRGGLLLVLLHREGDDPHKGIVPLAVCDPIAGTCNVLPPLACPSAPGMRNYALLTEGGSYSTSFKVIILVIENNCLYKLYTFSSTEPSWSMTNQCFDPPVGNHRLLPLRPVDAAVCHGTPHWLVSDGTHYYTLGVSAETSHVFLTKISAGIDHFDINFHDYWPHLSVTAGGALSLILLHKDGRRLETWTRRDDRESKDGDSEWLPSLIELNIPEQWQSNEAAPYSCFAERNGVVFIKDSGKRVYVADLRTGAPMEEMTETDSLIIAPFEVDLPAFFISRLRLASE